MRAHSTVTQALSLVMIGLGVALLVRTLADGGGQVGVVLGVLFVALGTGRLYLARKVGR